MAIVTTRQQRSTGERSFLAAAAVIAIVCVANWVFSLVTGTWFRWLFDLLWLAVVILIGAGIAIGRKRRSAPPQA